MANDLKIINDENYQQWIGDIKELVHVSQLKAAIQVNTEMIRMYWHIGKDLYYTVGTSYFDNDQVY